MADLSSEHPCHNAARAPCRVCGAEGLPCARCRLDYYCGKEHQRQDWPRHKAGCGVLEVREDAALGRHLVLAKDVPAGTVLLRELPLLAVVPPWTHTESYAQSHCVGCFGIRGGSFEPKCARCGWPVCGRECSESPNHRAECKAFQQAGFKLTKAAREKAGLFLWLSYAALRTHLASQNNPRLQRLQAFHSQPLPAEGLLPLVMGVHDLVSWRAEHSAALRQAEHWPAAARWLRESAGLRDLAHEDLVRAAGVNDINAVTFNPANVNDVNLKAKSACFLFGRTSLCEHSCVPTGFMTAFDPSSPSYEHVVVAARDLVRGDHLSLDYVDSAFQDAATRRALLRRGWSFDCRCAFCRDPTAAGLHLGATCCPKCMNARGERQLVVAVGEPSAATGQVRRRCRACGDEESPQARKAVASHERLLIFLKRTAASHVKFDEAVKGMLWPNGLLHQNHRHVLNAQISASFMMAVFFYMTGISEPDLARQLVELQLLLDAIVLVKPGLSHHRWNMLHVQFDLLCYSMKWGGEQRKKRILQMKKVVELLKPYYISPKEMDHFRTRFQGAISDLRA